MPAIVDQDVVATERGDGGLRQPFPLRVVGNVQFHKASLWRLFLQDGPAVSLPRSARMSLIITKRRHS